MAEASVDYIFCPECGFQNFSISHYCGRCDCDLTVPRPPPLPSVVANSDDAPELPVAAPSSDGLRPESPAFFVAEHTPDPVPLAPASRAFETHVASAHQVLAAAAVNALVTLGTMAMTTALTWFWLGKTTALSSTNWTVNATNWAAANPTSIGLGIAIGGLIATWASVWRLANTGQTLGHRVTGTRLMRRSGKAIPVGLLWLRGTVQWVSLLMVGAGYWWSIVDRDRRTWHDMVSGCVQVRLPE